MTVDYEEFSTNLGSVTVTLTFEEITDHDDDGTVSGVLGLAHYYATAELATAAGASGAGWHQAYLTQGGTAVWDSATGVTGSPYGNGANVYYRVYRVKASYTLTADQVANVPASTTVSGNFTITSSDSSMITWKQDTAIDDDGKTSAPSGTFDASKKAFTPIDLSTSWTGGAGAKSQYSATYIAVSCDGVVHTSNADITGTLAFADVTPAA